jgi:hypothetical protein
MKRNFKETVLRRIFCINAIHKKENIRIIYMSLVQDFNNLFSPMNKKYCDLFYGISVFYFLMMIVSIVSLIFLFRDIKRNKFLIVNSAVVVAMLGINYIYNRLLFNMCK